MVKICVVGSISTDFVVEADRRPRIGETIYGTNFGTSYGGKGANQAVATARLGAEVYMAGSVGDDTFGKLLLANLAENGINTDKVNVAKNTPSGSAVITLAEEDNSIIYVPGANNHYYSSDIDALSPLIAEMDIVLVQNETPAETIETLVNTCNRLDVPIIVNPAPARELSKNVLINIDYLTPNETEFERLYPGEKMEEVLAKNPNKLIITLGSKGAIFHDGSDIKVIPTYKANRIVDTTGAGDTFNGALAVAIASGLDLDAAIKFSNLAASISIQKKGAQGGSPTLKEIKENQNYEEEWDIK